MTLVLLKFKYTCSSQTFHSYFIMWNESSLSTKYFYLLIYTPLEIVLRSNIYSMCFCQVNSLLIGFIPSLKYTYLKT